MERSVTSRTSRKVQLLLQEKETSFDMQIDASGHQTIDYALQSPDLRSVELKSMMRRALKKQKSTKAQKIYWSAFMTDYVSKNANNNEVFE